MVICEIANPWFLRPGEYDILVQKGMLTKCSWWARNMTTNSFVDYGEQIGARIRGDKPFNAILDLEPGEYMFGTGDYQTSTPEGRRCSQVFYLLVDDTGGRICKKHELPSNGGSGPTPTVPQGNQNKSPGTGGDGSGGGYWSSRASNSSTPTNEAHSGTSDSKEYFLMSGYTTCLNDMSVRDDDDSCDNCDMKDLMGEIRCDNCSHGTEIYIMKS